MGDSLGDRMKDYEKRSKHLLPRRAYTLIRLDGKAFHTYTRGFAKPFDDDLIKGMNDTAKFLCENIQGAKVAYVQSDEITLLLTDFDKIGTCAFFDGGIQKIASITSSMASVAFNDGMPHITEKRAFFDSRCWSLSDPQEVENTFIWRQQDATRNSIQLVAQSLYSHKELHNKNTSALQDMIFDKGINWNDYDEGKKRGRVVVKHTYESVTPQGTVGRSKWVIENPPIFSKERSFLRSLIPLIPNWYE